MTDRFSRQSFLGAHAEDVLATASIGIVGLGGGGSHVVQQLAHLGFKRYTLFDHDSVEESNLNRLVGATEADAKAGTPKVLVARRMVTGLVSDAVVAEHIRRWQDAVAALQACDLVFGCVDSLGEREQLERACRRYLIPFIDIGLDVASGPGCPPYLTGQVIMSMPGGPCMRCLGFLTDALLATEARGYGAAGPRPQVVFANGVLASLAVGHAVALLTGWTGTAAPKAYLEYRGNDGTVQPSERLRFVPACCPHFPAGELGEVRFKKV